MSNDFLQKLSIKELLTGEVDYIIPMYQRNYAWEEGEITQLIQDVIDYLPKGNNYYMGTLVVYERHGERGTVFETIDGQQRLTTLSLLASYLKNETDGDFSWYEELNIDFESREHSRTTFAAIFKGDIENDHSKALDSNETNVAILNGYRLIKKILPLKLKENKVTSQAFAAYLFELVQIMRVKVPHDTDLNHYFEIMNSRGEQLEKHEVLKSRMLEVLNRIADDEERKASQNCLHVVWEACANMENYAQFGFTPGQRDAIFGVKDWGQFVVTDFDALRQALSASSSSDATQTTAQTLDEILAEGRGNAKEINKNESPERFNSVINFPNFLLHVLRVYTKKEDVYLDDKRLITTFENHVFRADDSIANVKTFTYALLRCKFLFDQYVIKREFTKGSDGWSLKRVKWNEGVEKNGSGRGSYVNTFGSEDEISIVRENRTILMLLSAFHVSTPTLVYKHWLNAALFYLFQETSPIQAVKYLAHLESVARSFVFDRFLGKNGGSDYYSMIYTNLGMCQQSARDISEVNLKHQLSFDKIENNFIFNYLDYLLWLENEKKDSKDSDVSAYEFTFRSSVEHYYPQKPMPGLEILHAEPLNSFGNLCLISHSKNSRLSNFMPDAKKQFYLRNTMDSVKQHLMMKFVNWDSESISEHYGVMKDVLLKSLEAGRNGQET